MAEKNPRDGAHAVSVDLPEMHAEILRRDLSDWIEDLSSDLEEPERLRDPDHTRAEVAAYQRLLDGVETGALSLPDEEACRLLRRAADAHDRENGYAEIVAVHDAMHALLAVFGEEAS